MSGSVDMRTYGNFRRPESPGLGNLGTLGTAVVFGGLVGLTIHTVEVLAR